MVKVKLGMKNHYICMLYRNFHSAVFLWEGALGEEAAREGENFSIRGFCEEFGVK